MVLGTGYFSVSDHLSSLKLKGLSIHLLEACTAPFSWKKCKCQHFLFSVVELLQEQFSNIFSAPLREICCTGVRWCGHCETLAREGLARPHNNQVGAKSALGDCEFIPILFWRHPKPFLPPHLCIFYPSLPPSATSYLFAVRKQQSPYWLEGNQEFIFFRYS